MNIVQEVTLDKQQQRRVTADFVSKVLLQMGRYPRTTPEFGNALEVVAKISKARQVTLEDVIRLHRAGLTPGGSYAMWQMLLRGYANNWMKSERQAKELSLLTLKACQIPEFEKMANTFWEHTVLPKKVLTDDDIVTMLLLVEIVWDAEGKL